MSSLVRAFREIGKDDAALAGGKGASLGEMTQAGIPVPPGFVVTAKAFDQFLTGADLVEEIEAILGSVRKDEMHTVEHASEKIQALILAAKVPPDLAGEIMAAYAELNTAFVAVRSSATAEDSASAAWAGQLESYLNTTEDTLLANVQKCWASLFTPRAIFYRFEKGLHASHISVAVVVQKMVESEISGIAFSVHPVTEDPNQLIIEAGYGLGEAIVSGQITPDSYVVEKEPRRIIDVNVNTQTRTLYRAENGGNEWRDIPEPQASAQVLTEAQILELSTLILRIESHYGFPCDIEWAFEKGVFYIVQSRPITTLSTTPRSVAEKRRLLVNTFSRENSVCYWGIWVECDLAGPKRFYGQSLNTVLVIVPPEGKKGSVWYLLEEREAVKSAAVEEFKDLSETGALRQITLDLATAWEHLRSFAEGKDIENVAELREYKKHIVMFWSAFNAGVWEALTDPSTSKEVHRAFLDARQQTERYAERWGVLPTNYFKAHFPAYTDILHVITFDEIIALAEGTLSPSDLEEIRKRKDGCFIFGSAVHSNITELDRFLADHQLRRELVSSEAVQEILGTTGFAGTARGIVRIIEGFKDLKNLSAGEILVTQMTNPEYVPAMKLAAAIVTDEGGRLCHAAIVARELKKPCVIGTKIATQALHDGDLIEVDADQGVIKIIERATPTALSKIYSRKKSLLYFSVWDGADIKGLERYLGTRIRLSVFVLPPKGDHEVWYSLPELEELQHTALSRLQDDPALVEHVVADLDAAWAHIKPYFIPGKELESLEEAKTYHDSLVDFWAATNTIFFELPNHDSVPPRFKEGLLRVREESQEHTDEMSDKFERFFARAFPTYAEFAHVVTFADIEALGATPSPELLATLKDRLMNGCLVFAGQVLPLHELPRIERENAFTLEKARIDHTLTEIKGSAAYEGVAQGRVKIVLGTEDMDKVAQGDVLVAPMTKAEYLPVMERAAAFITDEGGRLCHAAIVARELKKPCVIGTKIATQALHDGDLVEVDATNGVVRIIERAGAQEMRVPNINDYECIFESAGTTMLFEDLVLETYNPKGDLTLMRANEKTVYFSNETLTQMRQEGMLMPVEELRGHGEALEEVIARGLQETPGFAAQTSFTKQDAEHMFALLSEFAHHYYHFDMSIWDTAFATQDQDPVARAKVTLVGQYKNKIRAECDPLFFDPQGYFYLLVRHTSEVTGIPESELLTYRVREFMAAFDGARVPQEELVRRAVAWVYGRDRAGVDHFYSGEEALQFIHAFEKRVPITNLSGLTGTVAHGKGVVRGNVFILTRDYESKDSLAQAMAQMGEGDILVSPTTDPSMLPAIKKAAAIVTNVGGLLSHSAIVARELNIPCIIGTNDATRVLKTGDTVEVDATNGVVKIIQKI